MKSLVSRLLRPLAPARKRPAPRRARLSPFRPRLEALECRVVPAGDVSGTPIQSIQVVERTDLPASSSPMVVYDTTMSAGQPLPSLFAGQYDQKRTDSATLDAANAKVADLVSSRGSDYSLKGRADINLPLAIYNLPGTADAAMNNSQLLATVNADNSVDLNFVVNSASVGFTTTMPTSRKIALGVLAAETGAAAGFVTIGLPFFGAPAAIAGAIFGAALPDPHYAANADIDLAMKLPGGANDDLAGLARNAITGFTSTTKMVNVKPDVGNTNVTGKLDALFGGGFSTPPPSMPSGDELGIRLLFFGLTQQLTTEAGNGFHLAQITITSDGKLQYVVEKAQTLLQGMSLTPQQGPFGVTYLLTVNGDQTPGNLNDQIVVGKGRDTQGNQVVQLTVNGAVTTFPAGSISGININAGAGQNTVAVQAVLGGMTVNVTGGNGGSDNVTVGNAGSMDDVGGYVHVSNPPGYSSLTLDDSADGGDRSAEMNAGWVSGLGHAVVYYAYPDLQALTVRMGTGHNTLTIDDNPVNPRVQTTVFDGPQDTVNVHRTSGPLSLIGSGHNDYVNIGLAGSTQSIRGAVTVTNPPDYTRLGIDDSADPVARSVAVSNAAVTGIAPAAINYSQYDLAELVVQGGTGGNLFTVLSAPINNDGELTALYTGAGTNTVRMTNGPVGRLALYGSGHGTLDYAGYRGDVKVNLRSGTATGVSEVALGFDSAFGGLGNNLLIGRGGGTLIGGAGHNLLIDGNAPAYNGAVTASHAMLIGGSGENLLIGESLSYLGYYTNAQSVDALFAEWSRTDVNALVRMAHLRTGGGLNGTAVLNATTLRSLGDQDTLVAGGVFNWFWSDASDLIANRHPNDYVN
jgi:hypothetical protein